MLKLASRLRRPAIRAAVILLTTGVATALIASPASAHPVLNITASPTTVVAGNTTTITISGTSNGNYTGARIEVFSSTPSTGGTTGALTAFTSSPACGGGTTSCTEITNRYKLGLPNLTNGQAFSYTITLTIDGTTTAGTFTSKAQFYKSDNTTDGPRTGPLITVTNPTADLDLSFHYLYNNNGNMSQQVAVANNGPAQFTSLTLTFTMNAPFTFTVASAQISGGTCTTTYPTLTCTTTVDSSFDTSAAVDWTPPLLALGSFTVTVTRTASAPTDPNPTNDSVSDSCAYLTGLIPTC